MEFLSAFQQEAISFWQRIREGKPETLYKCFFSSPQFPFWFIIQTIYSTYVVHRSFISRTKNNKNVITNIIGQLIESALMTFLPREILALYLNKLSPIEHNPSSILIFLVIFILMTFSPYDIIYRFINVIYYFIGFLQGFNQTRLFTLLLRSKSTLEPQFLVPIALFFTISDQVIESIFRLIFRADATQMSSFGTIIRTSIFSGLYWLSTNNNMFTKYIGIYQKISATLTFAVVLGASNALAIIPSSSTLSNNPPPPPQTPNRNRDDGMTPPQTPKTPRVDRRYY